MSTEEKFSEFRKIAAKIIEEEECFSLKNLAIGGKDLIMLGFGPGPEIGRTLEHLLGLVIEGEAENKKSVLLDIAKTFLE